MPKIETIEAGTNDFVLFLEEPNKTTWRKEDTSVAPMFRPMLTLVGKLNAQRTNVNMALKLVTPVISTVNGSTVVSSTRVTELRHTALQNLDSALAIPDIDIMVTALNALKQNIVDGKAKA